MFRCDTLASTITVALSPEQFHALRQAIHNRKLLAKTIQQMEKISRTILFRTSADTRRRKRLTNRVLGLI